MKLINKLETTNLIIRPYTASDLPAFVEFMLCPQVTNYLNFTPEQTTSEGAKLLLETTLDSYKTAEPLLALVIAEKQDNMFIGSCGFSPLDDAKNCECFYALLPEYRNRGFATEAMTKLLDYGFKELEINRVIAHINKDNISSIRVAEKLGMKFQSLVDFKGIPEQGKLYYFSR